MVVHTIIIPNIKFWRRAYKLNYLSEFMTTTSKTSKNTPITQHSYLSAKQIRYHKNQQYGSVNLYDA